jgi:hypothetical protein
MNPKKPRHRLIKAGYRVEPDGRAGGSVRGKWDRRFPARFERAEAFCAPGSGDSGDQAQSETCRGQRDFVGVSGVQGPDEYRSGGENRATARRRKAQAFSDFPVFSEKHIASYPKSAKKTIPQSCRFYPVFPLLVLILQIKNFILKKVN